MFKFWKEFLQRIHELAEAIQMHKSSIILLSGQIKLLKDQVTDLKEELKKNG